MEVCLYNSSSESCGVSRFDAGSEEMDYHAFLAGINWRENPAPPVLPDDALKVRDSVGHLA